MVKFKPQAFMRMIRNNEHAPGFYLCNWTSWCGTFGCLYGNDRIAEGRPIRPNATFRDAIFDACEDYGLTLAEATWCFGTQYLARKSGHGIVFETAALDQQAMWMERKPVPGMPLQSWRGKDPNNLVAAMARLRKLLYYKLHKQEMMYEEDGRVKESARKAEGDHHVLRKVLAKV